MSVSLYRKYRPQTFSDVSGQKAAIDVITNSIAKYKVGHAYLFSGSRGCGKTSVARIFAKALNCLERGEGFEPCGKCSNCTSITAGENLDVIEIDGASNNGVDEVRELKANVTLAPFTSKYKIYIIDEVHMLSIAAFNALLKTLEEPPEHVIFILATTEPHKVPVTIRSRCQHIPFHSITPEGIFARLNYVCEQENIKAEDEALWEISRQADGALRDALSLLEQVTAAGDITLQNVEATFGAGSRTAFERWLKNLRTNPGQAYIDLKAMFDAGTSGIRIFEEMFSLVRNLWLASKWQNIADSLGTSESEKNFLRDEAKNWEPEKLHSLLNAINQALVQARMGVRNDILLGMFVLFIEPAPTENISLTPPLQVVSPQNTTAPPPVINSQQEEIIEEHVEYDQALKDELLKIAHSRDFLVYCGLYGINCYKRGDTLFLEPDNVYTYETLKVEHNAAKICAVLDSYQDIVLKFGAQKIKCIPAPEPLPDFLDPSEVNTMTNAESKNNKSKRNDLPKVDTANNIAVEVVDENQNHNEDKQSAFERIRKFLSNNGIKPEIVLLKHKDIEEETETGTEINAMEIDLEAEAEGDNDE